MDSCQFTYPVNTQLESVSDVYHQDINTPIENIPTYKPINNPTINNSNYNSIPITSNSFPLDHQPVAYTQQTNTYISKQKNTETPTLKRTFEVTNNQNNDPITNTNIQNSHIPTIIEEEILGINIKRLKYSSNKINTDLASSNNTESSENLTIPDKEAFDIAYSEYLEIDDIETSNVLNSSTPVQIGDYLEIMTNKTREDNFIIKENSTAAKIINVETNEHRLENKMIKTDIREPDKNDFKYYINSFKMTSRENFILHNTISVSIYNEHKNKIIQDKKSIRKNTNILPILFGYSKSLLLVPRTRTALLIKFEPCIYPDIHKLKKKELIIIENLNILFDIMDKQFPLINSDKTNENEERIRTFINIASCLISNIELEYYMGIYREMLSWVSNFIVYERFKNKDFKVRFNCKMAKIEFKIAILTLPEFYPLNRYVYIDNKDLEVTEKNIKLFVQVCRKCLVKVSNILIDHYILPEKNFKQRRKNSRFIHNNMTNYNIRTIETEESNMSVRNIMEKGVFEFETKDLEALKLAEDTLKASFVMRRKVLIFLMEEMLEKIREGDREFLNNFLEGIMIK